MSQTLAQAGLALNIGCCAVGGIDETSFRSAFGLADADQDLLLLSLLAGPITPAQQESWRPATIQPEQSSFDPEALRKWAAACLPDYMYRH